MIENQPIPHLEEVEKSVLSVIISRRPGWDEEAVTEDLFYLQKSKALLRLAKDEGEEIEVQALAEKAIKLGVLDQIGGIGEMTELMMFAPTAQTFRANVHKLRVCKARRMAIRAAHDLIDSASDLSTDDFLNHLGQPITDIIEAATATGAEKSTKELLNDLIAEYKDILDGKKDPHGWDVSLPTLSAALRGFSPKRVVVVSGYPSSGKTLLVGQFLIDLAKQGVPSCLMSFEMPREDIAKRAVVTNGRFHPDLMFDPKKHAMKDGNQTPSKQDLGKIKSSFAQLRDMPIFFEEATAPTIDQVIAMIRRANRKNKVQAFGIDYLQLIRAPKAGSKEQELTEISHRIQAIMKELGVLIFLLSQQNKDGGTKYATTTQEDCDYRLSIRQDMDENSQNFKRVTGLLVDKDRHTGKSGRIIPIERDDDALFFRETL